MLKISDYPICQIINDLVITKENNLYGFSIFNSKNLYATVIKKPQYSSLEVIDDYIVYKENDKFGLLDKQGRIIIEPLFSSAYDNQNGTILFRSNHNNDYLFVIKSKQIFKNGFILDFSNNYAITNEGIIDNEGNVLFEDNFYRIELLTEGYFKVAERFKYRNIDIIKYSLQDADYNVLKLNIKYKLIDKNGQELFPYKYTDITPFGPNRLLVSKAKKRKIIDYHDKRITDIKRINIEYEQDGVCRYQSKNHLWGLMNTDGEIITKATYNSISHFHNGIAIYKSDKEGLFDLEGNELFKDYSFKSLSFIYGHLYKDNKGIFNAKEGKHVLDNKDYLNIHYNNICLTYSNRFNKKGLLDLEGKIIKDAYYDEITDYNNGYSVIKLNNYYGLIDSGGNEILKPIYNKFSDFEVTDELIKLKHDSTYSLIKRNGNEIFKNKEINNPVIFNDENIIIDNYLIDIDTLNKEDLKKKEENKNSIMHLIESATKEQLKQYLDALISSIDDEKFVEKVFQKVKKK